MFIMRGRRFMFFGPIALLGIAFFTFLGGTVVKLLWNGLLPPLFGFPVVTFWQALGLLILSRILFGGFGRGYGRRSRMSPDEREHFRERMRDRFGWTEHQAPPDVM